jgi:hypothetical protein
MPLHHDDDRGGLHDHVVDDDDHDSMHDRSLHDRRWSPRGGVRKPGRAEATGTVAGSLQP